MNETNDLNVSIEEAREAVDIAEALERLQTHRDYIRVIGKGYITDEAVRLVHIKGHPSLQSPESQAHIIKDIDAIGGLLSYFGNLRQARMVAEKGIKDAEEELAYQEAHGGASE